MASALKSTAFREIAGYSLLFGLLLVFKVLYLPQEGLMDYDSVKNYQVAREMLEGNFQNMFRHASPAFNLLLTGLLAVFSQYYWAELLNSGLFLLATLVFCRFIARQLQLKLPEAFLLFVFSGTALTLTFLGRSLTFDGLAFLFYAFFLKHFYLALTRRSEKQLYLAAILYGFMFTVDYKVLVLLPIVLLISFFQRKVRFTLRQIAVCLLLIFLVFNFFAVLGWVCGQPWHKYYLVAGIIPFKDSDHPNRVVGFFNWDVLYYIKYLFFFENPLLVFGILLAPFAFPLGRYWQDREFNLLVFMLILAYCFLAGMAIIQKAPRGLLYAYPLLYTITFLTLKKYVTHSLAFAGLILTGIGFNVFSVCQNVYPYSQSNYAQVAKFLQRQQVTQVASTVSNRILPFAPVGLELKEVTRTSQLANLKAQGYQYLIIDDYYKITGIALDLRPYKNVVLEMPEPVLLSPLLALEHCEFAGFSFEEALHIHRELLRRPEHLRVVKL